MSLSGIQETADTTTPGWSDAPQDILHDVLRHLVSDLRASSGHNTERQCYKALSSLRAVSKSWRAAVKDFPAHLICDSPKLKRLCKTFPATQQLVITLNASDKHDLAPVAECTRLSDISISSPDDPAAILDITHVPATVTRFKYQAAGRGAFLCLKGLKRLPLSHYQGVYSRCPLGLSIALHSLSKLKDLDLDIGSCSREGRDALNCGEDVMAAFWRMRDLTSLRLSGCFAFTQTTQKKFYPETLCKLKLINVLYTQAWLDEFIQHLARLTSLTLCAHGGNDRMAALQRGYSLGSTLPEISGWSLANLKELSRCCRADDLRAELQPHEIQLIAALRGLTRLGLSGFRNWDSLEGLRKLPLQELILSDCNNLELELFVPGALQSLQALVITDAAWVQSAAHAGVGDKAFDTLQQACQKTGKVLRQLPYLTRVQGDCALFTLGMEGRCSSLQLQELAASHAIIH